MDRRLFLKFLVSIPVVGSLGLFVSPLVRYLRPSLGPLSTTTLDTKPANPLEWTGQSGLFSLPDQPQREKDIVFSLSDFPKPWSFQTFTFGQKSVEYTSNHFQATKIPGYVVRLPELKPGELRFDVVSRICPHMGCVFNFLEDPHEASAYNYPQAKTPLYACPCHLSVYDPLQKQDIGGGKQVNGKVVSGPAPRPPRTFVWTLEGDRLVITEAESGGIS
jgi:Rieske Fe-S protein